MYAVSDRYKEVIYSQDCRHKLRIWFNEVELEDADIYCEKLTVSSRVLPTGSKVFGLDNFVCKEATLILHDVPLENIVDQIRLSLGTLVDGEYEYVPLGVFNIQDKPTTDKNKTTIKLRDNAVKFDINYNAKPVIDANGGTATKLQIFKDICDTCGVSTKVTSFLNDSDLIGIYDNTIKARTYISYIAEQSGAIATIDRDGDLIFVYLNKDEKKAHSIDSIRLDDAINDNIKQLKIDGNYHQETRSGKNLLNYPYFTSLPATQNGVTWSDNNGKLTATGTATGYSGFTLVSNLPVKANTNYRFYIVGTQTNVSIDITGDGLGINIPTDSLNNNGYTFNTGNATSITINIKRQSNSLVSCDFYPMLVTGSYINDTDYEPYGLMPSPDYPSEVEVVEGYNEFGKSLFDPTLWNVTGTEEEFSIQAKNTGTTSQNIPLELSEYSFDGTIEYENMNGSIILREGNDIRTTILSVFDSSSSNIDKSVVSGNSDTLRIIVYQNTSIITFKKCQLVKGTTSKTYLPYQNIGVKNVGKNLLNQALTKTGKKYDTNGSLINGNANDGYIDTPIKVKPSTEYTASGTDYWRLCEFDENGNLTNYHDYANTTTHPSFTTTPTTAYILLSYSVYGGLDTKYLQVEKDTQTPYEPYKEIITPLDLKGEFIGKLPNGTQDYLTIDNQGNYGIQKNVGKVVLDGSESGWVYQSNNKRFYKYFTDINLKNVGEENTADTLSNYFKASNVLNVPNTLVHWSNALFFYSGDMFTTVEEVKTWLSENNVTVYYELEEPYFVSLGKTPIKTLDGVNNIQIVSELPIEFTLDYYTRKQQHLIPLHYIEKYTDGNNYKISRVLYEDGTRKFVAGDETGDTLFLNTANPYISSQTQIEKIYELVKNFVISSYKTGKIIGNPAIDSYDLISITDDGKTFVTLANHTMTYNGVIINSYDTQIGLEKRKENISLNGEEQFRKWAKSEIDNVNGKISIQAGLTETIQNNLNNNFYTKEQTNQFVVDAVNGAVNTFSTVGGGNLIKDSMGVLNDGSWSENVTSIKDSETLANSIAGQGIMLNNGVIEQLIQLPNAVHTLSFVYKKRLSTINAKLYINETVYDLDSLEMKIFEEQINVTNNSLNIKFESDTDNACYILDLMLNLGQSRDTWSQNQNETTTSTVKIGKGIQVESSSTNTYWRADSDGSRVFNKTTDEVVREDTDKGTKTKQLTSTDNSIINGVLFTKQGKHRWLSGV